MYGNLALSYLYWHYHGGIRDLLGVLRNLYVFLFDFFSLRLLLRTLFAPWKRLDERDKVSILLHPNEYLAQRFVNLITRLVGFFARSLIIIVGVAVIAIATVLYLATVLIWLFLPLIIILLVLAGIRLLLFGL